MTVTKPSVLIVGAGELGAATAVSLSRSGNYGPITIIDRSPVLPAVDAASCDINKMVRADYAGPVYAKLAKQAIDEWCKPEWKGIFYQRVSIKRGSGCVIRGMHCAGQIGERVKTAYKNITTLTDKARLLNSPEEYKALLAPRPDIPFKLPAPEVRGYYNPTGGWANATAAVEKLYEWAREGGVNFQPSTEFEDFLYGPDERDVIGVRSVDGREFRADKVVIALGSWSGCHPVIGKLMPEGLITATGQTVAAIQLNDEQYERYKGIPASLHHDGSGYYSFPPNEKGILKFALHRAGYTTESGVPRTVTDPKAYEYTQANGLGWIPKDSLRDLREQLALIYPELAELPTTFTRMCWYSDVRDGDWVIDVSPEYPSLVFATGGAGHAFKFLPIIGDLVRSRMEGTLDPQLAALWRVDRTPMADDPARKGMARKPLVLSEMVTQEDLASPTGKPDVDGVTVGLRESHI